MLFLFALCFALQLMGSHEFVGDKCHNDGVCELFTNCEAAKSQVRNNKRHSLLRCGFHGNVEIVCCPTTATTTQRATTDRRGNDDSPKQVQSRIADRECENIKKNYEPALSNYIIGGKDAVLGEFVHMAALGFPSSNPGMFEFDCGGSLISDRYVLTAGHCLSNRNREQPSIVRLGVVKLCPGGATECAFNASTDQRVDAIVRYPNYTTTYRYDDIALLRLASAVTFTELRAPVCLYSEEGAPGAKVVVAGFGIYNTSISSKSNVLLQASLTYLPTADCRGRLRNGGATIRLPQGVIDTQLCAVDAERDTCQGDSGGPLMQVGRDSYFRLVGVTSSGGSCGSGQPALYTNVNKYLDWIESVVWPSDARSPTPSDDYANDDSPF